MRARLIALVNDEPTFRHIVSTALMREGYAVHSCQDEEHAVRVVRDERPAAIVVETTNEGPINSMNLVERIRQLGAVNAVPVIVCSADARFLDAHSLQLYERGCQIIGKPFDVGTLLESIDRSQGGMVSSELVASAQLRQIEALLGD